MSATTKLNIGKIPISKGEYQEGTTYQRLNQVTMLGSTYQSKIDDNTSAPAQMGADGAVENINTDKWLCVAVGNVSAAKKVVYNNENSGLEAGNVQEAIDEVDSKVSDLKGYTFVDSTTFAINSTVTADDLHFQITAHKKYLIKVSCSKPHDAYLSGNPKLNYIDGKYYKEGKNPVIILTNGQGSIIIGNDTDTSSLGFGFPNTELSTQYEGDYTFTLFELLDGNSESLISLKQNVDEISSEISDIKVKTTNIGNGFVRIFHSMGVIGDSLSSGEIVTGNGTTEDPFVFNDRYNFSWLANIARKYNADWKCFSAGGHTTKSWLSSRFPSMLTSEENKRSVYFIALGTNDISSISAGQFTLGTKDSNSDEDSFAGYYKKIIELVHTYSENSVIMCCTTYGKETTLSDINSLIQEISDLYDYCYFVNIAQKSNFDLVEGNYARGWHYDTMGYVKIADAIEILVDDVIENNKRKLSTWGVNAPN